MNKQNYIEINRINEFRDLCIKNFELKNNKQNALDEDYIDNESSKEEEICVNKAKKSKKTCEYCGNTFLFLKNHKDACKKRFAKIEEHGKEVLKNETFLCSICGTCCKDKYLLKRHIKNVHAAEKNFKCTICERVFASSKYLRAHEKYHTGDRTHICTYCGKGYITAADLCNHEKIHTNKRAYKCEICPKAFNTSSDLYKHKICVHGDKSLWKYVCSYCTKRFPLKINLQTHIRTHTGERNFECHLCQRKFTSKSSLNRHIETHTNFNSFKCDICLQTYKYQKSLQAHLFKVHNIGTESEVKVTKFICHICPKSYTENNKLEKHIRTHTGERPFSCTQCNKTFIDKSYVRQHVKIAHKNTENTI
ncbi:unnamed protein product [Brassicogethes aeneus]|uniref:C2H2-type domain-containing protein n=1 Tax=Brassicogethes aeneus TaxID=1431903 RepID=A0A9P0FDD5_BRAAE|nr:unnamed protein product [Brassicogethes aeneus]